LKSECSDLRPALLSAIDGEAGAETRARVTAHLSVCARCREIAHFLGAGPIDFGQPSVPEDLLHEMRLDLHRRLDSLEKTESEQPGAEVFATRTWQGFLWDCVIAVFRRLFLGTLPTPKPLAWAAFVLILVLCSYRPPIAQSPNQTPVVIMDNLDQAFFKGVGSMG